MFFCHFAENGRIISHQNIYKAAGPAMGIGLLLPIFPVTKPTGMITCQPNPYRLKMLTKSIRIITFRFFKEYNESAGQIPGRVLSD
jgi:hypothetical protein